MKKFIQALVIAAAASLLSLALWQAGVLDRLEYATWSWRVRSFAQASPSTDKIKVILLDQASLDWGASENGWSWPWPRQVYAPIIDFCKRGGAKSLSFDVLYTEPSVYGVEDDALLGEAIGRGPPFAVAAFLGRQAQQATHWPEVMAKPAVEMEGLEAWLTPARAEARTQPAAAFPVEQVATQATYLANVNDVPDSDAVFRRSALFNIFDGALVPTLGLAALLSSDPGTPLAIREGLFTAGEDRRVAIDGEGRAILRFRGPSGTHQALSAAAVIQSELRLQEGGEPPLNPDALKDCHVLFGFSAPGLKDLRPTPVSGDYPGVEIHATLLDNLLEGDFLRDVPLGVVVAGTLLPAILAGWLVLISRKVWQTVAVLVVFLLVPLVRGFAAYKMGFWWPVVEPGTAMALTLVSTIVLNYATEGRQKRFIKSAFGQYLSGEVIERMMNDPSALKLGGEKKTLSLFFSDIEKFSSFSEILDPPRLTSLLNDFLSEMSDTIMDTGGTLDKYVGDAIVAFWNAPMDQDDHAVRACRAAVQCQKRLAARRDEWQKTYGAVVRMRIGLNTGDVVVGNLGSSRRFSYTVLGDAANLASRLEGANKAFGTYIMVAEATWKRAGEAVFGRELGALTVVGRKAPVRVYELIGLAGDPVPSFLGDWERGIAAVREGRWDDAARIFEAMPDDKAAKLYVEKCRSLVGQPAAAWDGVWSLTEK
jgi:adenylate cyclase